MKDVILNIPKNAEIIVVPIYNRSVVFCTTKKASNKMREMFDRPNTGSGVGGYVTEIEHGGVHGYLVAVLDYTLTTAAHEASHLAFAILDRAGVPVQYGDHEEAFCYLVGFLTDKFMEIMNAKSK